MRLPDEDVGRLRKYLTEAEVQRLLLATNETEDLRRNRALILIAYRHGLRVTELVSLTWPQDVDLAKPVAGAAVEAGPIRTWPSMRPIACAA
jgi:site-specific recombinase XerD